MNEIKKFLISLFTSFICKSYVHNSYLRSLVKVNQAIIAWSVIFLLLYSVKRYQQTSSLDYWKMERETHDECLRWIIFSFPKVSNLTRTLFFLNPQMSSGVWTPPSWSPTPSAQATTCSSPSPGAQSPVSWVQSRCVIIITLEWSLSLSLSLFQKMSEGEKCCWVCTWCQVMLSLWRIPMNTQDIWVG